MTNLERWKTIPAGSIVEFDDGPKLIKLQDQWDRYTGINDQCAVEIGNGIICHIAEFVDLYEEYTGQFN